MHVFPCREINVLTGIKLARFFDGRALLLGFIPSKSECCLSFRHPIGPEPSCEVGVSRDDTFWGPIVGCERLTGPTILDPGPGCLFNGQRNLFSDNFVASRTFQPAHSLAESLELCVRTLPRHPLQLCLQALALSADLRRLAGIRCSRLPRRCCGPRSANNPQDVRRLPR
jgi:hypothetical protein